MHGWGWIFALRRLFKCLFPPQVLIPVTGKTDFVIHTADAQGNHIQTAPPNPPTLIPIAHSVSPPVLSQSSPLAIHSSRSRPEQHFSVIQSTGLAANSKSLALLSQPHRESSSSSSPIALTHSPNALASAASPKRPKLLPSSSSPQHLPLSLSSSPKPVSVPSPPCSAFPLSTSPKDFTWTSSVTSPHKSSLKPPHYAAAGSAKANNRRKLLEDSLAQISEFRLKQVSRLTQLNSAHQ